MVRQSPVMTETILRPCCGLDVYVGEGSDRDDSNDRESTWLNHPRMVFGAHHRNDRMISQQRFKGGTILGFPER